MNDYIKETEEYPLKSPPLLGRLDMELTERCNNNCIHCYINLPINDLAKEREMSTKDVKAILTEAADLGCLTIRLTGGEPLLREDFEEIYLFARKLGLRVLLFTNGTLITPHLADLFAGIPPKEKIEISVYGMSERSYEAITRNPGSFQAAMRGIKLLLNRGVPFVVKTAVLPLNRNDLDQFEAWAATIPWMSNLPMYSIFFDLRARRDSNEKNRLIEDLRLSAEEGIEVLSRDRKQYLKEMGQFCTKFMRSSGDLIFSCGAGHGGCVDSYGKFQPCMLLRHPDTVYNLKTGSLKEALTEFFPQLRKMKACNSDYLNRCSRCFLHGLCQQCPARSWMEHGTLDTPVDYLCRIAHARAVDLGFLQEGEQAWKVKNWKERLKYFEDKYLKQNI